MTDEILEEVYAVRRKIAEECGYDFKRLVESIPRSFRPRIRRACATWFRNSDPEPAPAE